MSTPSKAAKFKLAAFVKNVVEFMEHEDVQASLKKLPGIVQGLRPQAQQAEIVTYNEVVEYFVKSRPNNEQIVKGALMMEEHSSGKKLTFLFLDASNEPVLHNGRSPYGKVIVTNSIDEALVDFSEGRSVIIFE